VFVFFSLFSCLCSFYVDTYLRLPWHTKPYSYNLLYSRKYPKFSRRIVTYVYYYNIIQFRGHQPWANIYLFSEHITKYKRYRATDLETARSLHSQFNNIIELDTHKQTTVVVTVNLDRGQCWYVYKYLNVLILGRMKVVILCPHRISYIIMLFCGIHSYNTTL
jgi:hypothetical protein